MTQLVRSPGAYLMEPKDPTKQVFIANLMPSRGSWLELEIDKKGIVYARIDRKRKLPITTLLRALPAQDPSTGFELDIDRRGRSSSSSTTRSSSRTRSTRTRRPAREAVVEVFKQRPGEPPTLDNARNLLRGLFFDPKRYDLTKVGRYKLNQRLERRRGRRRPRPHDGTSSPSSSASSTCRSSSASTQETKDYAADAIRCREPIRGELDEYEHFGNRRLRTVGELIQRRSGSASTAWSASSASG